MITAADRSGRTLWVDAVWDPSGVLGLTVRDDGTWKEASVRSDGLRGRGLPLMRRLMDDVRITADADHTAVEMTLQPLAPASVVVSSASDAVAASSPRAGRGTMEVPHGDGTRLVRLRGEVDATSVRRMRADLEALVDLGGPLAIDATDVDYLDSAGVALLWDLAATLEARGLELRVIAPLGSRARRVLELSGSASAALLERVPGRAERGRRRVKSSPSAAAGSPAPSGLPVVPRASRRPSA